MEMLKKEEKCEARAEQPLRLGSSVGEGPLQQGTGSVPNPSLDPDGKWLKTVINMAENR